MCIMCLQEVVHQIMDAYRVCEQDPALLVQTLTSSARQPAMDALPAMRSKCLSLVCAAMAWPEFRSAPSSPPASAEAQPQEGKEAAPAKDAKASSPPQSGYKCEP